MKKVKALIAEMIFFVMCCSIIGCGADKKMKDIAIQDISRISVTYENKEGLYHRVSIDFDANTKNIVTYGEEQEEMKETFETSEEFLAFIKDTVLPYLIMGEEKTGKNSKDEQKVLWHIQVIVGDESYQMNGFADYPNYWDTLISYMEMN